MRLNLLIIALTLAGAYAVKRHYASAPVDELDYILRPTAALVEITTGTPFEREARTGYVSREARFVIARPCAGVNFWIVAACASVVAFVRPRRTVAGKLATAAACIALSFGATLVANTTRIAIALWLHNDVGEIGPLSRGEVHHLEGVLVYTFFLCLFFALARARSLLLPLACYVVMTVVVPLLNGARPTTAFVTHAAVVIAVALSALVVSRMLRSCRPWRASTPLSGPSPP